MPGFSKKYKGIDIAYLEWYGQKVCAYYGPIVKYLESQELIKESLVFSLPQFLETDKQDEVYIAWNTEAISDSALNLTELSITQQVTALNELQELETVIKNKANELLASEQYERVKFGQLLLKAIQYPDHSFIYFEDGKLIITAWGMFSNSHNNKKVLTLEKLLDVNNNPEVNNQDSSIIDRNQTHDFKPKIESTIEKNKQNLNEEIVDTEDKISNENSRNHEKVGEILNTKKNDENNSKNSDYLNWLKIAAIIAMLLFLCFFLYNLFSHSEVVLTQPDKVIGNKEFEVPFPKMKEIDPRKIQPGPDQDSIYSILNDRMNLALVGHGKNVESLVDTLNSNFDTTQFEVTYISKITNRIQIEGDFEYLQTIQKKLNSTVRNDKILVWFERIFKWQVIFNDPGLKIKENSWYLEQIQAYQAWDITTGDSNIIIAVLDSGFDLNHSELKDKYVNGFDVSKLSPLESKTDDIAMHGTHVAALCLGTADNSRGVSGVAPSCKLMPIKVGDDAGNIALTYIIDGVLFAIKNGARVINISIGADLSSLTYAPYEVQEQIAKTSSIDEGEFWNELFKLAESKNITIVLAAGNDHVLSNIDPMKRSSNVIIVGASDKNNSITNFSNFGSNVSLSAPGEKIYSAINGNQFKELDGTSMSSPIVAGACALLISKKPSITTKEIIFIFQNTGSQCSTSGEKIGPIIQIENALKQIK